MNAEIEIIIDEGTSFPPEVYLWAQVAHEAVTTIRESTDPAAVRQAKDFLHSEVIGVLSCVLGYSQEGFIRRIGTVKRFL